jgi:hypothetical protein
VEAWNAVGVSPDWQTVDVDLSPAIRKPGEYVVEILRTEGEATLETAEIMLLIAGTESPRLITPLERSNAWLIRRTDQVTDDEKGCTILRMKVRHTGGAAWKGEMRLNSAHN